MRFVVRLMLAIAMLLAGVGLLAPDARAEMPARLIAVGDLHGDHDAFREIMQVAGLTDARGRWTGGATVFVQLGDVTDRGPESLAIIHDLQRLEKQAEKAGGEVVVLIGNHEAMNIIGDVRYVTTGEFEAFADRKSKTRRDKFYEQNKISIDAAYSQQMSKHDARSWKAKWESKHPLGWVEHRIAWQPGGKLMQWYVEKPAIAKIGDTLFVHGGISPAIAAMSIDDVNRAVREALESGATGPEAMPFREDGPLWYRGHIQQFAGGRTPEQVTAELDAVLDAEGASRLVIAHTPHLKGIEASHGGRLIRIDTGISQYYGGVHAYLEFADGAVSAAQKDASGNWTRSALPVPGDLP